MPSSLQALNLVRYQAPRRHKMVCQQLECAVSVTTPGAKFGSPTQRPREKTESPRPKVSDTAARGRRAARSKCSAAPRASPWVSHVAGQGTPPLRARSNQRRTIAGRAVLRGAKHSRRQPWQAHGEGPRVSPPRLASLVGPRCPLQPVTRLCWSSLLNYCGSKRLRRSLVVGRQKAAQRG